MKKIRYIFITTVGLLFFSILLASSIRNIYLTRDGGANRLGFLVKPLKIMAETPSLVKKILAAPEFFVENTQSGDGFTYFGKQPSGEFPKLLVSG